MANENKLQKSRFRASNRLEVGFFILDLGFKVNLVLWFNGAILKRTQKATSVAASIESRSPGLFLIAALVAARKVWTRSLLVLGRAVGGGEWSHCELSAIHPSDGGDGRDGRRARWFWRSDVYP